MSTPARRADQVLALLLEGKSTRDIAAFLTISRHTAGHHVQELLRRYAVRDRVALLALFLAKERAAHAECLRLKAIFDRRGKPTTVDVIGEPMGRA